MGGNTEVSPRITDIIFGALAGPLPERIPASLGGTSCCFLFGGEHPDTGDLYSHFHFEGIGWGGRPAADGNSQVIVINGNCRNTPVEVFESRYPLRVESYRLLEDSGGPGLNRGGLGIERILTMVAEEVTVSAIFNRMRVDPFGIHGGMPGANSGIYVRLVGDDDWYTFSERFGTMSPSKFSNIRLRRGDQVKIVAPGGGGWGDPLERSAERVIADVAEGLVTPEAALRDYGLVVERQNGTWGAVPVGGRASMSGRWIEREPMYLSFDVYNCAYCGKNVPRHVWLEDIDGDDVPFCAPEVADIHLRTRVRHDPTTRHPDSDLGLTEQLRMVRESCRALHRD